MTPGSIDKAESIAKAVLYEGYMLYPYRPSATKNRQRCTFGTLYPQQHPDVLCGTESCRNRTQCLVSGPLSSTVTTRVRFLHMRSRLVEACVPGAENQFQPVDAIAVGTQIHQTWDEAVERTVEVELQLGELLNCSRIVAFEFPSSFESSDLYDPVGKLAGLIRRMQLAITGRVCFSVEQLPADSLRLTVEVLNTTPYAPELNGVSALLASFASAHTILGVRGGEFVSLLDPPAERRETVSTCKSVGVYPVLVGEPGEHDVMLSSPIILYDYSQIAPESAGDFFDSTEMDEMLTLRIMTLTDGEKSEMRSSDDRLRELLERTETTAREQLRRTHGAVRSLRPIEDDAA